MLKGYNQIGYKQNAEGDQKLKSFSTLYRKTLKEEFTIATRQEVEWAVDKAVVAFSEYKIMSGTRKAEFLEQIAVEMDSLGDALIERTRAETGLSEARLRSERNRTIGQLKLFADLLREGSWVDAVIDTAEPDRQLLPRADMRKMNIPIGPVAVFGAANFPFAFSTAGGDTASALAAGNPVIVKAHPSHLGTNEMIGGAIIKAAKITGMPDGVFSFVIGESGTGLQLVKHPGIKAVGFTGSYQAGMAICKVVQNERDVAIPVYAEMSSINPVLILPSKINNELEGIATQLASSIILGAGQFCTNPGLLFLLEDANTPLFIEKLSRLLAETPEAVMVSPGIAEHYHTNRQSIASQTGVNTILMGSDHRDTYSASATVLQTYGREFIANPELQNEVFGPFTLIVRCTDRTELLSAIRSLRGQLTVTVQGEETELLAFSNILSELIEKAGRIIFNGVPTGVEVCHAMVHGGPFPATTDARYTSVGSDAIRRFVRPFCFQDCPAFLLPDELKDENPLAITRKINGHITRNRIETRSVEQLSTSL